MPRHLEDTLIGSIYGSRNIDKILIEKAGIYMEISYFDGKNVKGNPARKIGPKLFFTILHQIILCLFLKTISCGLVIVSL